MLNGSAKRIFTKGPPGPPGATLAAALTDVSAAMKAALTAIDLPTARTALGVGIGTAVQAWSSKLDAIVASGLTNAMLAQAPAYTLKANLLASAASPADVGLSAMIDAMFGNTRGALLYRSGSGWGLLAPGTSGQYLGTGGSGADPSWGTPQGAGNVSTANSPSAGPLAVFASSTSIQALALPVGQCRLVLTSTTQITLMPYKGNQIWVAGAYRTIPAGGVPLANTGLTAGSAYYVYVYWSGSALGLLASTTAHAPDANTGCEVASSDGTRTYVGQVGMAGSSGTGTFADSPTQRLLANWFTPPRRTLVGANGTGQSGGTVAVEVNGACRVQFVANADEPVALFTGGVASNSTANQGEWVYPGLDGNAIGPGNYYQDNAASMPGPAGAPGVANVSEGAIHTATLMMKPGGGTTTVVGSVLGVIG